MTIRDQALNLHNQGLKPEEIVAALSTQKSPITKGEILTKIAQCRREDPDSVRPDDVSAAKWAGEPAKLDFVELVKAWNLNPDAGAIAKRFGVKRKKLVEIIGRLRCKGVALLPALAQSRALMQKIREAALSVLSEEQKAALAAPKRKAKVHNLPEKALA